MDDIAIKLDSISKYFKLYSDPKDRLKEALNLFGKKYFKEFYALNNINLDIKKGEILGIIGKNGAGKSTLLKIISRVLAPTEGSLIVNGKVSALLELGAGFNPEFSGIENVYFYGTIIGLSKNEMESRLDSILSFADIGDFINQPLKTYSSGMKARLAFAVATEVNPDILIVDEVLAVGDALFQRKCYGRINKLFKDGKTVLLVSHNKNSIASLCENSILLENGKLIQYGKSADVISYYEMLCNKKFVSEGYTNQNIQKNSSLCKKNEDNNACYDPSLDCEKVYLNKSKVAFISFDITNDRDELVNVLNTGESYRISASFKFEEDLKYIHFALRIKNIQGIIMSWNGYPFNKNESLSFEAGEECRIELSFTCNLMDGVYTMDAALQSFEEDDILIHVGITNISVIKVKKNPMINYFGMTNMNFRTIDYE